MWLSDFRYLLGFLFNVWYRLFFVGGLNTCLCALVQRQRPRGSWERPQKKSPWHNNHLPYIVKERTYLLGSTPCVRVGHGASIFFSRWCPSGASNFRPDMAAQCAKLHKTVSLFVWHGFRQFSLNDSRNNYLLVVLWPQWHAMPPCLAKN